MKKFLALAAILMLTACQDAPTGFTPEPLDFTSKQPININVAEVKVIEAYQPPDHAPNIDQDFPVPPAAALKLWVKQRLYAVGTSGVLEITIDDASVKEVKLPVSKGIDGIFKDEQDARYDLHAHVTMKLYNGADAMSSASGDVVISRSKTIKESATADDRTRIYDQMTRDMMTSFDQLATTRLTQYFAAYLR